MEKKVREEYFKFEKKRKVIEARNADQEDLDELKTIERKLKYRT